MKPFSTLNLIFTVLIIFLLGAIAGIKLDRYLHRPKPLPAWMLEGFKSSSISTDNGVDLLRELFYK